MERTGSTSGDPPPLGSVPDDGVQPRWLTPDEREAWLALMGTIMRLPPALDAQLQRDAGVSLFDYQVLAVLSEAEGRCRRMSDLAILAEGSLARMSQAVARLEKRGWITRAPDLSDGRYTLATLTDAGWEKVAAAAPGHVAEVRRLVIDVLTRTQLRHLAEAGRRVARAIDPGAPCPGHLRPGD